MAESTLSIGYDELQAEIGIYLGYDPSYANWTAAQVAEVDRYIQSGIRQFYYPPEVDGVEAGYPWSFLSPVTTIDTADGDGAQDLPDDLGRVLGDFYFDDQEHRPSIILVSEGRIMSLLQRSDDEGCPQMAAIRAKAQTAPNGQRFEIVWWPIPDAVYTLNYKYEAYTGKLVQTTNPYPLGGMKYAELITESCLSVAEQRANDEEGIHTKAFFRILKSAIAQDRKLGGRFFGDMGNPSESINGRVRVGTTYPITYKEETW